MLKMDYCGDFMEWLGPDISIKIFSHLDDPSDLVRACSISKSWRQFVIANGLCKQHCLRMFPEMSSVAPVVEVRNLIEPIKVETSSSMEWECLKREHKVYAFLARGLSPSIRKDCISEAICASSTDNFPEESIQNTLEARDRVEHRASYWSSEGDSDPTVPERLLYKLIADMCIINEIHVQPFQAYFQFGFPIYSAKAVRFRMGHPKFPLENDIIDDIAGGPVGYKYAENFIWSYVSPEFPMAQENRLQSFKLPEPVLCIGGILLVELLGRVQRQEMDGLYYMCISHVQVVGRPLSRPFGVEIIDPSGKCTFKYCPESEGHTSCVRSGEEGAAVEPSSGLRTFTARLMQRGIRGWEQMLLNTVLGTGAFIGDDESDEEFAA